MRKIGGDKFSYFQQENGDLFCCGSVSSEHYGLFPREKVLLEIKYVGCFGDVFILLDENDSSLIITNITNATNHHVRILGNNFCKINMPCKVRTVGCGRWHVVILDDEGSAWGLGKNHHGQLGLRTEQNIRVPQKILTINGVQKICCGEMHTIFITKEKVGWACGSNQFKQLGMLDTGSCTTPVLMKGVPAQIKGVACGSFHTLIVDIDGGVWGCGKNELCQLGLENGIVSGFTKILNLPEIEQVACGNNFSLFLDRNGVVWCCGDNEHGQLGTGNWARVKTPEPVPDLPFIVEVATGGNHSMFLDHESHPWMCGANDAGQLGMGDTIERTIPERLDLQIKLEKVFYGKQVKSARNL